LNTKYSDLDLHNFIKSYVKSEGGEVLDVCEEYFTINLPGFMSPRRYTYQPAVSREKKIELIATGSPVLENILQDCLSKGIVASIALREPLISFDKTFKDADFNCELCEKADIEGQTITFCTKSPKCHHRIYNGKIRSTEILKKEPVRFFQFYYSVLFKNKSRKNEELIKILIDEKGSIFECNVLENLEQEVTDYKETIEIEMFDKLKTTADERLDLILKDKKNIFDMLLKKQNTTRLKSLEKKLDEEKLQGSIFKEEKSFDENEWQVRKSEVLLREEESLQTHVSIKFLNLLVIIAQKIDFKIFLTNGSEIESSYIMGITKNPEVKCPECGKVFYEGYATEDGFYLCEECVKQSLETGKIYSKNFNLAIDSAMNEYIEESEGFRCAVCGKLNSKFFEFRCSNDSSSVCYACYSLCAKCEKLFSNKNVRTCKDSGKEYCIEHIVKCDNCGGFIGIDKYRLCEALGKKVCSCTRFGKCILCDQEYSIDSLTLNKCPACRGLTEVMDPSILLLISQYDHSYGKTKKWLFGTNKLNTIAVAKGSFSDTLFVVRGNQVVSSKKISFLNKLRGY
jgi:hypothetical protein